MKWSKIGHIQQLSILRLEGPKSSRTGVLTAAIVFSAPSTSTSRQARLLSDPSLGTSVFFDQYSYRNWVVVFPADA